MRRRLVFKTHLVLFGLTNDWILVCHTLNCKTLLVDFEDVTITITLCVFSTTFFHEQQNFKTKRVELGFGSGQML